MNKVALITGGQQGIGFAVAKKLVAKGYLVAIASLPDPEDKQVQNAMSTLGKNVHYYQFDVTQAEKVDGLLDRIAQDLGEVTTLVSNAGVPAKIRGDMLDILKDNFESVLSINLTGGFFLAQQVAKRMLAQTGDVYKSIIFITSVSAEMASIERAEYCISKAAASMMSKLFALRLAPYDIGVFEVQPGIIQTEMTAPIKEKYTPEIEGGLVPVRRWGFPEDVADAVLPLVEGNMRFSIGDVIKVDGGLSISRF